MKSPSSYLSAAAFALTALLPVVASAQTPNPAVPERPFRGRGGGMRGNPAMREAVRAALSPEEFNRLRSARQAAMADPAVQSAWKAGDHRGARQAMRDAMLRADPQIGPVMQKAMAARRAAGGKRGR